MSRLFSYFSSSGPAAAPVQDDKPVRALPQSWYTSPEMYELERRAIFSGKWQLITHSCRFKEAGDWLKFDIAGFQFVLCRDRQGKVNGFHNVCRHRAFPVAVGEKGCAKIFQCQYHGWSYGLNGKLAKAPGYSDLPGFEKEKNGLFPIHVHVDVNGFIWVNLDAKPEPEIKWEDDFANVDRQERYSIYNFDDYYFDHYWDMNGAYNWKILADNYNECYHCKTSHPDISTLANLQSYNVNTKFAQIIHDAATTDEQRAAGLTVAPTYYFPNVSTNVAPHFFMIQRFVPSSAGFTSMQYQVFRNKNATDEQFDLVNQIYKRIMSEDKALCAAAQQNLNAGIFVNGELHPKMEQGPIFFQRCVRTAVTEHHAKEQAAKQEIWPARQKLPQEAMVSKKDIDFCSGLECATPASKEGLAW